LLKDLFGSMKKVQKYLKECSHDKALSCKGDRSVFFFGLFVNGTKNREVYLCKVEVFFYSLELK
jgi:hypothetical protein